MNDWKLEDWKQRNNDYLVNDEKSEAFKKVLFQEPSIYKIDTNAIVSNIGKKMIGWVDRHSDTSIVCDKNYSFYSNGTFMIELNEALVVPDTCDILVKTNGNYVLYENSHHSKEVYSWILFKNNILDVGIMISNLLQCRKVDYKSQVKKTPLMINTRWAGSNYYHWMHEAVPRLQILKEKELLGKYELVWIGRNNLRSYHKESLIALGINPSTIIYIDQLVHFERLAFLSILHCGAFHHEQSVYLNRHFSALKAKEEQTLGTSKRIFLARRYGTVRALACEKQENMICKQLDLVKIYMDNYSVGQQVKIMSEADYVLGPHGAALTNVVGLSSGARVVEMMPRNSIHPLYWYLSAISNLKYSMVVSEIADERQSLIPDMLELECYSK